MNLFQLECFITLAETLNYTKASQMLHTTQPNLSRMIINLEHLIGTQLFIRNKRNVQLTTSGETFYQEIKKTLESYQTAITKTKEVSEGTSGVINLGFLGTAVIHLLPPIIHRFQNENPNIKIRLEDYTYSSLLTAFEKNQIDMAILPNLELTDVSGQSQKMLLSDNMCVVVHETHPFATREQIHLIEIKDEPFIHINPKVALQDFNLINTICMTENFLPNTAVEVSTLFNMMMMVDCQYGITILADHMQHFGSTRLRFIPLVGFEDYFQVVCVWRDDKNPALSKLLEFI